MLFCVNFLNGFWQWFGWISFDCLTYILYTAYYMILLPTYIHIPTLYVYGYSFLHVGFLLRLFPPLWLDLFAYDSRTGHFMKLECLIILSYHMMHIHESHLKHMHIFTLNLSSHCSITFLSIKQVFTIQCLLPCSTDFCHFMHNGRFSLRSLDRHSHFVQTRNLTSSGSTRATRVTDCIATQINWPAWPK